MSLRNPAIGGSWITPTLGSIWAVYGIPFDNPGYRKDSFGIVTLRGWIAYVSGTNNVIFTLPTGYRPPGLKRFLVSAASNTTISTSMIEVRVNGEVWWGLYGDYAAIGLDQISFATY